MAALDAVLVCKLSILGLFGELGRGGRCVYLRARRVAIGAVDSMAGTQASYRRWLGLRFQAERLEPDIRWIVRA